MNEDTLRAMIREAVARHLSAGGSQRAERPGTSLALHPSHHRYTLTPSEGPCVIEPAVPCNHCGYCESHGH